MTIESSRFVANEADVEGGAIYGVEIADSTVVSSTFTSNTAGKYGGAISLGSGEGDIGLQNILFADNKAIAGLSSSLPCTSNDICLCVINFVICLHMN